MAEAKRTYHQSRGKPIQYILSSPKERESPQERQTKVRVKVVEGNIEMTHLPAGDVAAKDTDLRNAQKGEGAKDLTNMYCR